MPPTNAPPTSIRSSCLCNRIRLTVTGTSDGAMVCHCRNCQKASGSAFAYNHDILNATIVYESGEELVKAYEDADTESGSPLQRSFCSNCGSNLFVTSASEPGLVVLNAGAIEGSKAAPIREIFTQNKEGWVGKLVSKEKHR